MKIFIHIQIVFTLAQIFFSLTGYTIKHRKAKIKKLSLTTIKDRELKQVKAEDSECNLDSI